MEQSWHRFILVILVVCALFVSACGNAGTYEENETEKSTQNIENIAQYSGVSEFAFCETGYYYVKDKRLNYCDLVNAADGVVCSRAECNHTTSDCDAFVQRESTGSKMQQAEGGPIEDADNFDKNKPVNCVGNMIFYSENFLYMIERTERGDYLIKYDSRFNNREEVVLLTDARRLVGGPNIGCATDTAILVGDYLYYTSVNLDDNPKDNEWMLNVSCHRVKIDGKSIPEKIGEFSRAADEFNFGYNSGIKVMAVDNKVYFLSSLNYRVMTQNNTSQFRIALFDITKNEFDIIINADNNNRLNALAPNTGYVSLADCCCIDNLNNIYFLSEYENNKKSIMKMSLKNREVEVLYTYNYFYDVTNMIYFENKVYAYCRYRDGAETDTEMKNKIIVFNLQKNSIDSIELGVESDSAYKSYRGKLLGVTKNFIVLFDGVKVYGIKADF